MIATRMGKKIWLWAGMFGLVMVSRAWAIPSPEPHVHTALTVDWADPGAPALDWDNATANSWNHNHLTGDSFVEAGKWDINKAWDNRTLHRASTAPGGQFGHGMIVGTYVRFGFTGPIPVAAQNVVTEAYNRWQWKAKEQFEIYADPWDRLGMSFERVDSGGAREITITFQEGYQEAEDAYAAFAPGIQTLTFESTPTITLSTNAAAKRLRILGEATNSSSLVIDTPWSFDGTAESWFFDIEYSDDSGANWFTVAPGGFGDLDWNFGTLAADDEIEFFEMDFTTIALHEVGHTIFSFHTGSGSAPIMRDDIGLKAHFGQTMDIDADSALAAAITYTYAIPSPAALPAGLALISMLALRRRNRRAA